MLPLMVQGSIRWICDEQSPWIHGGSENCELTGTTGLVVGMNGVEVGLIYQRASADAWLVCLALHPQAVRLLGMGPASKWWDQLQQLPSSCTTFGAQSTAANIPARAGTCGKTTLFQFQLPDQSPSLAIAKRSPATPAVSSSYGIQMQ